MRKTVVVIMAMGRCVQVEVGSCAVGREIHKGAGNLELLIDNLRGDIEGWRERRKGRVG